MKLARRTFLQFAGGVVAAPAFSSAATAQTYPTRPITMIVPTAAGSSADLVGRVVAERMRKSLGEPIIIENVTGADGSIGDGRAARAKPDGYTINLGFKGTVLNGAFYSLPYNVLNDFVPISPLFTLPLVLVARKTMPARDLNELIAWLKANPNKASAGVANVSYRLLIALFQKETGTQFTLVPYRGSAPEMQDLIAGQIDFSLDTPVQLPLARGGIIKAYAVTSETRLAMAADIPTFAEMGLPTLTFSGWGGLFAPKGTPKDIIGKLDAAAVEALADPVVRSRLVDFGYEVFPRERQTPDALDALVKSDAENRLSSSWELRRSESQRPVRVLALSLVPLAADAASRNKTAFMLHEHPSTFGRIKAGQDRRSGATRKQEAKSRLRNRAWKATAQTWPKG
jgi:tripartite-type tricarboxylate transporter receptor subunit TctC